MLTIFHWAQLDSAGRREALARPAAESLAETAAQVRAVISDVRTRGDAALLDLTERFDGVRLQRLRVDKQKFATARAMLTETQRAAIRRAIDNVEAFHEAQALAPLRVETMPGVVCERVTRPIAAVGLYAPAGTAPLPSSVIMSAVPARVAGCKLRILCTPPDRNGNVNAATLFAAEACGVADVYCVGGAQAIAAMAFGTETIPSVDKIFGPGSRWVTAAKQIVAADAAGAAFDLPAGPSEVLVIADETANPQFVAADLLAQAEHDVLSQAILLTTSLELAERVRAAAATMLGGLSRRTILEQSLRRSRILLVPDIASAIEISNHYAPEHLIIETRDARDWLDSVEHAGSVFLGSWTPEPMGDYCSGTNHVLPTYGYARAYSGLSLTDFTKRMTVQELSASGLQALGPTAITLAGLEGLDAHAQAVQLRLDALDQAQLR